MARVVPGGCISGVERKNRSRKSVPGYFTEGDGVSLYGLLAIWHCMVPSPPLDLQRAIEKFQSIFYAIGQIQ